MVFTAFHAVLSQNSNDGGGKRTLAFDKHIELSLRANAKQSLSIFVFSRSRLCPCVHFGSHCEGRETCGRAFHFSIARKEHLL